MKDVPQKSNKRLQRKTPLKRVAIKSKKVGKKGCKRTKRARKPTLSALIKKTREVFNRYIRERDSQDGWFTCVSCHRTLPVAVMNAGHYVPVKGGSFLRFHEWNVNGECAKCNGFDEFHLIGYRKSLVDKIGEDAVIYLEENRWKVKKWTREELEDIIKKYSK